MIETLAIIAIIVLIVVRMAQTEIGGKVWKNTFTRLNSPACPPATGTTSACPPAQTATKSPTKNKVGMIVALALLAVVGYNYFTGKSTLGFGGYSKTFEVEVTTLRPHKLCGVPAGEYTFTIPFQRHVMIMGDDYDVTSYVRVNKALPNDAFTVNGDGCVEVSFAFNSRALGLPINPQIIAITFKKV